MDLLVLPAAVLGVLAAAVLAALLFLLVRRTMLSRGVGAFECSLRRRLDGGRWMAGIARYADDRLDWFRLVDLSWRPHRSLTRAQLTIVDRRRPAGGDETVLSPDWVLVRCRHDQTTLDLGMSELAYTGLATWLQSAPPGEHPVLN